MSLDWRKICGVAAVGLLIRGQLNAAARVALTPMQASIALGVCYFAPSLSSFGKRTSPSQLPPLDEAAAKLPSPSSPPLWRPGVDEKYAELLQQLEAYLGAARRFEDDPADPHEAAADALRRLLRETRFITASELTRNNAEKLFWIHKNAASLLAGGMAVRFTVQLNLFGGTVANLGDDSQRKLLDEIFARGELGCFALTEEAAGVLSGLVVETTATWDASGYVLHTPRPEACKFWISSGLKSRWAVVIARLVLSGGVDMGPHAFLVDLHNTADVLLENMEPKTEYNDLDNAFISFTNSRIPHAALLSGISYVDDATGSYRLRDPKQPFKFEDVAQRLLSGRLCISLAGLSLTEAMERAIRNYDRRIIAGKDATTPLVSLPAMRCALDHTRRVSRVLSLFAERTVLRFSTEASITPGLVEQINCAKILVMRFAIDAHLQLKGRIGAKALQASGPFGAKTDLLYVFQFAEGDSGILKQKMARDTLGRLVASPLRLLSAVVGATVGTGLWQRQSRAALALAWRMAGAKGGAKVKLWLGAHELVEQVAVSRCIEIVRREAVAGGASHDDIAAFDMWFGTQ